MGDRGRTSSTVSLLLEASKKSLSETGVVLSNVRKSVSVSPDCFSRIRASRRSGQITPPLIGLPRRSKSYDSALPPPFFRAELCRLNIDRIMDDRFSPVVPSLEDVQERIGRLEGKQIGAVKTPQYHADILLRVFDHKCKEAEVDLWLCIERGEFMSTVQSLRKLIRRDGKRLNKLIKSRTETEQSLIESDIRSDMYTVFLKERWATVGSFEDCRGEVLRKVDSECANCAKECEIRMTRARHELAAKVGNDIRETEGKLLQEVRGKLQAHRQSLSSLSLSLGYLEVKQRLDLEDWAKRLRTLPALPELTSPRVSSLHSLRQRAEWHQRKVASSQRFMSQIASRISAIDESLLKQRDASIPKRFAKIRKRLWLEHRVQRLEKLARNKRAG